MYFKMMQKCSIVAKNDGLVSNILCIISMPLPHLQTECTLFVKCTIQEIDVTLCYVPIVSYKNHMKRFFFVKRVIRICNIHIKYELC